MLSFLKELRQPAGRGLDISGSEHPRDHRDAIGTGIDHLPRMVDGDAADGEYRHIDVLLDLPENPQRDIGALGFGGRGKRRAKGHVVSALTLSGHSSCDIAIT